LTAAPIQVEHNAPEDPVAPDPSVTPSTTEEQPALPWSLEGLKIAQKADWFRSSAN